MRPGVVAERADLSLARGEVGPLRDLPPHQEEGRSRVCPLQDPHQAGARGAGAVVERERDSAPGGPPQTTGRPRAATPATSGEPVPAPDGLAASSNPLTVITSPRLIQVGTLFTQTRSSFSSIVARTEQALPRASRSGSTTIARTRSQTKVDGLMRGAAGLVAATAVLLATPAIASQREIQIGRSVQGRPIHAVELGDPAGSSKVLVVGCVHGDECAGVAIVDALERLRPSAGVDLWLIRDLNPDGATAGTRQNAHGVDLNRNFSWRWRPMGGVYESGPRPFSERESRLARALILRVHPHLTIWFHQHLDMVCASGGDRRLEKVFARVSGLPYHPMPQLAGSAVSWQNNTLRDTTAFAAELPPGEPGPAAVERYVRAVLAAARSDQ